MPDSHHLWTFKVKHGDTFQLKPPGNPTVILRPPLTVFHLFLTESQALSVAKTLHEHGALVEAWAQEGETEEQHAERLQLLGIGAKDVVFPTVQCPSCFWVDPMVEGRCGYRAWPKETVKQAYQSHERARDDLFECSDPDVTEERDGPST